MATSKTLTPTNQTISIPEMSDTPNIAVPADAISKEADAINTLNSKIAASVIGTSPTAITSGSSLNSFTAPGNYVCTTTAIAQSLTNCPVSSPFELRVYRGVTNSPVRGYQELYVNNSTDIYVRSVNGDTWTDWQQLALNSNVATKATLVSKNIESNTSAVFTFENNGKGILLIGGNVQDRSGIYAISCASSGGGGAMSAFTIASANGITLDTSTAKQLTVTATGAASVAIIPLRGSVSVA